MGKTLKVTLPISDANAGVIQIVAKRSGWDPDQLNIDGSPRTPEQVCAAILGEFIGSKVDESFEWYYGVSQRATKEQIMALLNQQLTVVFEDDPDDGV